MGVGGGDIVPIVFGDESARLFFASEHPVLSELLEGPPASFDLFGVVRSCLLRTFCLREQHFLSECLTINDHHFHPTTTATASAIPAAVPPTIAGMEILVAFELGVAVLEFVEFVTSPIRRIATLTLPVSGGMTKGTEDCYRLSIPSLYTP